MDYTIESTNQQQDEIKDLRRRLVRRMAIVDEIRKAYLRDVVSLKHVIEDILDPHERELILHQYIRHLPTADIREVLKIHGPHKGEIRRKFHLPAFASSNLNEICT